MYLHSMARHVSTEQHVIHEHNVTPDGSSVGSVGSAEAAAAGAAADAVGAGGAAAAAKQVVQEQLLRGRCEKNLRFRLENPSKPRRSITQASVLTTSIIKHIKSRVRLLTNLAAGAGARSLALIVVLSCLALLGTRPSAKKIQVQHL
jgi:hypothetical protein